MTSANSKLPKAQKNLQRLNLRSAPLKIVVVALLHPFPPPFHEPPEASPAFLLSFLFLSSLLFHFLLRSFHLYFFSCSRFSLCCYVLGSEPYELVSSFNFFHIMKSGGRSGEENKDLPHEDYCVAHAHYINYSIEAQ